MTARQQVVFHGIAHSAALEAEVRERAAKLERFHPRIISWRASIEEPARHQHTGRQFVVRLDIRVAGGEVAVNREHDEDPYVAVHDAFDAARRQLEDLAHRQRGDVKRHGDG